MLDKSSVADFYFLEFRETDCADSEVDFFTHFGLSYW
jgi:hypothetical protein